MDLRQKILQFPERPGVYQFKDAEGRIIYIGKAKSVKDRVLGHYRNAGNDRKEARLTGLAADVDYILTDSEIDALVLEAQLVRRHQPRYNILLKDDKKFPWIKVTREAYPRAFITRDLADDGSRLFGPYTDATALKRTMAMLREIFPLRTCGHDLPRQAPPRPCLNHQIGRCHAPCAGKVSQREYQSMVDGVVRFLRGKNVQLARELERKRDEAARELKFEEAAHWRDQLQALSKVTAHQKTVIPGGRDADLAAFARRKDAAYFTVLQFRDGRLAARSDRTLQAPAESPDAEVVAEFLQQHYWRSLTVPQQVIVPVLPADRELIAQWLSRARGEPVAVALPAARIEKKLMALTRKQVDSRLDEVVGDREKLPAKTVKPLLEVQRTLGLEALPRLIACFDISHTGGDEPVASAVTFRDGRTHKAGYRHLKMKYGGGVNDPAMIAEAVGRYLDSQAEKRQPLPDLLLVDGGMAQLSAALHVMAEKGYTVPAAGLAKRLEELYTAQGEIVSLPRASSGLHLLQRLRDEAHRFAQKYHHLLRERKVTRSGLEDIPGIGPKTAQKLLKHFGSAQKVKAANREELEKAAGKKTAAAILAAAGSGDDPQSIEGRPRDAGTE
ncbi:MAG: excinuclease ABC subunit UvrC [Candidatus Edwardsbacteria bacterium]|jgi:excinuclease ABC subunit C|nr:excinuclease ABC subunit UvrC [Candidatus Edwardsbacteria bacterium]